MSIQTYAILTCDWCMNDFQEACETIQETWKTAETFGWKNIDGEHWCEYCYAVDFAKRNDEGKDD